MKFIIIIIIIIIIRLRQKDGTLGRRIWRRYYTSLSLRATFQQDFPIILLIKSTQFSQYIVSKINSLSV